MEATVVLLKHRGRSITAQDLDSIRSLIAAHPTASRRALSSLLCQAWNWRQENGALRDMVCRGLMLALHRQGLIALPPVRQKNPNPLAQRTRPKIVPVDSTELCAPLGDLQPLEIRQVRRTAEEPLVNSLIEEHHYLGYTQPVGEHLKYLILSRGRPIACFAWSSAPRHLGPRDRFIGWSPDARRRNIRFLAYNTRFLILPWVKVPHLASYLLGRMARIISLDWERIYGHAIHYLESFTDASRFRGTCYRAANWVFLGQTTGRGNNAPTKERRVPLKEILGYPLSPRFREILSR